MHSLKDLYFLIHILLVVIKLTLCKIIDLNPSFLPLEKLVCLLP